MHDIIGIKVKDKIKGEAAFITWGRIFDRINPKQILEIVTEHLINYDINNLINIEVCYNLQEVSHFPYFYEGFFYFAQQKTQVPNYETWIKKKKKELKSGKDIYFIGFFTNN